MEKYKGFTDEELVNLAYVLQRYMLAKDVDHSLDIDQFTYKIAAEIRDELKMR